MRRIFKPRWLDLILLAGIICLYLYVTKSPALPATSPWLALWANATSDLLTIWLASRVIEGVVSLRQRRQQVVLGFRGTANYIMNIVADIMPAAYPWNIRRLENEIRWFDMRLERQAKYLKRDEKDLAKKTSSYAKSILSVAQDFSGFKREARRQRERANDELSRARGEDETKTIFFRELYALVDLEREFNQYMLDREAEGAAVLVAASEAKQEVDTRELDDRSRTSLSKYIIAARGAVDRGEQLKRLVNEYIQHVRDSEITLLGRVPD